MRLGVVILSTITATDQIPRHLLVLDQQHTAAQPVLGRVVQWQETQVERGATDRRPQHHQSGRGSLQAAQDQRRSVIGLAAL